MSAQDELKYRALAEIALSAVAGMPIEQSARKGLAAAIEYIDLAAGALILWDERRTVTARAAEAPRTEDKEALFEAEETLLARLRKDFHLGVAYFELGEKEVKSLFSLPIESGGRQFGALIGIKRGRTRLYEYDEFLRALAAALALASRPAEKGQGLAGDDLAQRIAAEKSEARLEIAIAVNHYINNPLTALLGNLQLLGLKHKDLPEEVRQKLTVIEDSARQIGDVTKRLMNAAEAQTTEYIDGIKMTDFFGKNAGDKKNNTEEDEKL